MPYFSRWKTIIVWLVVLLSIVVALPNAVAEATLERLPDWVPKKQLMLGLDRLCDEEIGQLLNPDSLAPIDAHHDHQCLLGE